MDAEIYDRNGLLSRSHGDLRFRIERSPASPQRFVLRDRYGNVVGEFDRLSLAQAELSALAAAPGQPVTALEG